MSSPLDFLKEFFEGNIVLPLVLGAVTGTLGLLCIRGEQRIVDWLHRRRDKLAPK